MRLFKRCVRCGLIRLLTYEPPHPPVCDDCLEDENLPADAHYYNIYGERVEL